MTIPVKMYPVTSSQITYIGYVEEVEHLYVTFKNGQTYRYEGVSKEEFLELKESDSVGSYFAENIKSSYPYTKL